MMYLNEIICVFTANYWEVSVGVQRWDNYLIMIHFELEGALN